MQRRTPIRSQQWRSAGRQHACGCPSACSSAGLKVCMAVRKTSLKVLERRCMAHGSSLQTACNLYNMAVADLVACMRVAALVDCSPPQIEMAARIIQLRLLSRQGNPLAAPCSPSHAVPGHAVGIETV